MNESNRQDQFLRWLDQSITAWSESLQGKASRGDDFEAVLDRIRVNVARVYRRMFELSIDQHVSLAPSDPRMRQLMRSGASKEARHPLIFSYLLEKISGPWARELEEALAHEDEETAVKERVKLEVTSRVREKFLALYPEVRTSERA